jgi:hypothetical protein
MARLPKWVVDNRTSVEREAAPYRMLTPEERWRAPSAACRSAARQLAARPDRQRILDYRDPLPESTIALLCRLRAARSSSGSQLRLPSNGAYVRARIAAMVGEDDPRVVAWDRLWAEFGPS